MAAKEAEQVGLDEEDEELREDLAPGDCGTAMLIVSDSYENLAAEDYEKNLVITKRKGHIHDIVRQSSQEHDSSGGEQNVQVNNLDAEKATPSASEDSSDQSDSGTKELSGVIDHISRTQILEEDEDVKTPEWRQQRKHVFILSDSGKPVYSRYGNEDKLVTIFGVMQALVSFVQDSAHDTLRSIVVGDHRIVFLQLEHIILVCVTRGAESDRQIRIQLHYLYNQVLSVLTLSSLKKIFKQRRNYDLRRQLSGSEKFLDSLLNMMDTEPGLLLGAVRCLPLENATRDMIAQSIVQHGKVKDLVFALIIANSQLVTLVRMKKYFLHPMDLHLIINLINSAESFKAAESWTPICLPKFDSSGFLQAHISYLDEECQTCLLLLSVDRDSFFTLSACKTRVTERLIKYNGLRAIADSLRKDSYNISKCGISDLRHFLYKNKSTAQYTSPELLAPYLTPDQQERLFGLYHYLHNRIHSSSRPLKILYHVGQYEALLGWVTGGFELYAVFGPLVTKSLAINAVNKLMAWIRKEANRLFILESVTF
ncbi:vacuolar fusion protein MON1 homolog A-like [Mercenaria mercenaria]|uniref:vacuolar fusion protein MON1 homolog A-like n=1 Tax=Mercenaria mercenaria TaxID=6596 RepID=UPI00234E548E|nr:vacuolar fusion protein MON1 homolog A-like [Mercenaria mercenaria]